MGPATLSPTFPVLAVLLAGCFQAPAPAVQADDSVSVPFELWEGDPGRQRVPNANTSATLIGDEPSLRAVQAPFTLDHPPMEPEVDFGRSFVLLLVQGLRTVPDTGFGVRAVNQTHDAYHVNYVDVLTCADCGDRFELSFKVVALVLPRLESAIPTVLLCRGFVDGRCPADSARADALPFQSLVPTDPKTSYTMQQARAALLGGLNLVAGPSEVVWASAKGLDQKEGYAQAWRFGVLPNASDEVISVRLQAGGRVILEGASARLPERPAAVGTSAMDSDAAVLRVQAADAEFDHPITYWIWNQTGTAWILGGANSTAFVRDDGVRLVPRDDYPLLFSQARALADPAASSWSADAVLVLAGSSGTLDGGITHTGPQLGPGSVTEPYLVPPTPADSDGQYAGWSFHYFSRSLDQVRTWRVTGLDSLVAGDASPASVDAPRLEANWSYPDSHWIESVVDSDVAAAAMPLVRGLTLRADGPDDHPIVWASGGCPADWCFYYSVDAQTGRLLCTPQTASEPACMTP